MKIMPLLIVMVLSIFVPSSTLWAADRLVPETYGTIQAAIDAADSGDVVKVAKGVYQENIVMKEGVSLEGGYSTDFSTRNISLNATTIDGGKIGSVVRFENITAGSIDGFIISNGYAGVGGGIFCSQSSPRISHNIVTGNTAQADGGGIRCYKSNPTIIGNTISNNEAESGKGGGICCNQSNPEISENSIRENKAGATDGGGIHCYASSPTLSRNTIQNNRANRDGGGIYCASGSHPVIRDNTLLDNDAGGAGGGMMIWESSATIAGTIIKGNKAGTYGGGIIFSKSSNPSISNTIFAANEARYGGGVHCYLSDPAISNCILSGNHAFSYGGAANFPSSAPSIVNCTIVRNSATDYAAVYLSKTDAQISNTIFWQNSDDLIFGFASKPVIAYSDIKDARFSNQNGNISEAPLFADIDAGDYSLSSGSPCIDAGNPAADQKDPDGSRNNIGAFGGPGAAAWGTDIPKFPVAYKETSQWEDLGLYGGQIYSLAIDPTDNSRIFAGSFLGDGLFVSQNGGETWQRVEGFRNRECFCVALDPQNPRRVWVAYSCFVALSSDRGTLWSRWRLPDNRACHSVAVDPTDSNTVYIGAGGTDQSSLQGAVFKTEDGGKTWTQTNLSADKSVRYLAINPSNHQEIWAITGLSEPGSVYKTQDEGKSWEKVDVGHTDKWINQMIIHPEQPSISYISGEFGVIKTADGGKTWENVGINKGCKGVAIDPNNFSALYASTYYGSNNFLYRSLDAGASWEKYPLGNNAFGCLAVDPFNSGNLYGGDHGLGVFKSADMGVTWRAVNQGITANIVYDSEVDTQDPEIILSATQAGLFNKREPGKEWKQITDENAFCAAIDPRESRVIYAGQDWSLAKSQDNGATWQTTDISSSSEPHRVSSIAVDPEDSSILFVGVLYYKGNRGEVYRSTDAGKKLNLVKVFERPVNTVKINARDPQMIYAGTGCFQASSYEKEGGLYKSCDGGSTWIGPLLQDVVVNTIAIDPANSNVLYAGCGDSGDNSVGLFKSLDGGVTWEKMPFDSCAVTEILVHPSSPDILYASTLRRGVYMSVDGGENWVNIGLSDYAMFDLSLSCGNGPLSKRKFQESATTRSLYAGTNSGMAGYTGRAVYGFIFDSTGATTVYPAKVWLDVGQQGQYHADVWSNGKYLILHPPVGDGYDIFCTASGYSEARISGVSVAAMAEVPYDLYLTPSGVPDAPALTVSTSGTTLTLSWTSVAGASGYMFYFAPYPDASYVGSADMGTLTGGLAPLWEGAAFYVAVTAYNSVGSSGFSNIEHFLME